MHFEFEDAPYSFRRGVSSFLNAWEGGVGFGLVDCMFHVSTDVVF